MHPTQTINFNYENTIMSFLSTTKITTIRQKSDTPTKLAPPEFPTINSNYVLVKSKHQYDSFLAEWKSVIDCDIASMGDNYPSQFASLMIFRNIMLGDDVYKGFRPHYKLNNLKNGHGFMSGWVRAYEQLHNALRLLGKGIVTVLGGYIVRLSMAIYRYSFNTTSFNRHLLEPSEFYRYRSHTYIDTVNDKIIEQLESNVCPKDTDIQTVLNSFA